MYTEYYGLTAPPFQLTPDERYFFASRPHRKALSYLNYGLSKAEGFVVITGEIGAGKTTVLAHLRASLTDPKLQMAWLTTTQVAAEDLLRLIAAAFGVPVDAATDKATLLRLIETTLQHVHADGKRACLVIDEAQSLRTDSLEELRMLSNFHRDGHAMFQIFLVGQPEFRKTIAREDLEQLRQRVIASFHLTPLDQQETRKYIEHRLRVAGWQGEPLFADSVFDRIFVYTSGIPRKINLLCDRLLLHGFLAEIHFLTDDDADEVITELSEELPGSQPVMPPAPALPAASLGVRRSGIVEPVGAPLLLPASGTAPLPADGDRDAGWRPWTIADDREEAEEVLRLFRGRRRRPLLWMLLAAAAIGVVALAYKVFFDLPTTPPSLPPGQEGGVMPEAPRSLGT